MKRDELIRIAREAGFFVGIYEQTFFDGYKKEFELFAKLVAAAKCKELAEELRKMPLNDTANSIAIWIENEML